MDDKEVSDGPQDELSKSFKQEPTLEHYVKLRRSYPGQEIEISVLGGFDAHLELSDEYHRYGIDPTLVISATLDSNPSAVSALSLQLIDNIVHRDQLTKARHTHLSRNNSVVPEKMVDWLITCMLDGLSWSDRLHIPRDLIVLIRERLGGVNQAYQQSSKKDGMRDNAVVIAAQMLARGETPSVRAIASVLGTSPPNIVRWFPDKTVVDEAREFLEVLKRHNLLTPDLFSSRSPDLSEGAPSSSASDTSKLDPSDRD